MESGTRLRAATLFGALSHPGRIEVVELLTQGEMSVNEIADQLAVGQSSASQFLAALSRVGLLSVRAVGTKRLYRLRGPRIPKILDIMEEFCSVHGLTGEPAVD